MKSIRVPALVLLALLLISFQPIFSAADPNWYTVDLDINPSLLDNTWSIDLNNDNVYLGTLSIEPSASFDDDPTAIWNGNFTLVITSIHETFRFVKVGDDTRWYPVTIHMIEVNSGPHAGGFTSSPATVSIPIGEQGLPEYEIRLDVESREGKPVPWRGTYFCALRFALYVDYGLATEVLISNDLFNMTSYFVEPQVTPGNEDPIQTELVVERYASANQVDVPQLIVSNSTLKVGSVTFFSNDDGDTDYRIIVGPGEPNGTVFAFYKNGDSSQYIPYKVYVPTICSPTGSCPGLFEIPITTRSPAGYFQQSFELAIAHMNYLDRWYTAGDYTSLIRLELISY